MSLSLSPLSLPHALLSKQSGLYQDEPQPKQAKQKIRARKSARRRGRILSCQPLCASLPTGDAPPHPTAADPSPHTHTNQILASQAPNQDSRMVFCKGLAPDLAERKVILRQRVKANAPAKREAILGWYFLSIKY